MMKMQKLILGVMVAFLMLSSCKKEDKILDCFGEAVQASLQVTVNATNPKQVTTEVKYLGDKKVTNVEWEFGDGITLSTSGLTTTHTYIAAGNYTVRARVTLNKGTVSCDIVPTRVVNIL